MNISRRLVIFIFFLLMTLLLGMLFWPFIFKEIITPTSLATWVLLRIFVLSIDQKYSWVAIIFIASLFLYRRLLPRGQPIIQTEDFQNPNETMRSIGYWRKQFVVIDRKVQNDKALKRELAYLLVALYATRQHTPASFRLYDALQSGQIPLPEHIHALLFPEDPQESGRSIIRLLRSIQKTPQNWIRRWTGQEAAEHYQMIDEVLGFMETSLEIKNDKTKSIPNKH